MDAERAAHAGRRHDGVCGERPGADAYEVGGEDDEGVGNLRSKSFVNLIEMVGGLSVSEGRCLDKKQLLKALRLLGLGCQPMTVSSF